MSDEDWMKILLTLYTLRNATSSNIHWDEAQEAIYKIEHHLGVDLGREMRQKTASDSHVEYKE